MSPMAPPLALTRYHRSPHRSAYEARRRSGLALRFNDPTKATALGWKNSSRSPRCWGSRFGVTGFRVGGTAPASAGRGLARQHREVEARREHARREAAIRVD